MAKLEIHVGIVAYNLPRETEALVKSCVSHVGHEVIVHLYNHSPRNEGVWDLCARAARGEIIGNDGKPVHLIVDDVRQNVGLVVGWNKSILACYGETPDGWGDDSNKVCIIVNDDVEFDAAPEPTSRNDFQNDWEADVRFGWQWDGKSDVDRLAEYAHSRRDLYMVAVLGYNDYYVRNPGSLRPWLGIGWSCFAMNPRTLRVVGVGDENIVPYTKEDVDWGWRAQCEGEQIGQLQQTRILHWGSLHWQVDDQVRYQNTNPQSPVVIACNNYFMRKWGGQPGGDLYKRPFDNPNFTNYIAPENRAKPYGVLYDRTDLKSVIKI